MPHSTNVSYEFGPYRLNLAQRVLTRDGEIVSLTPKATDILVLLVMNAGQLVEKDDLLKEVWPDTFVEESNLTQNIFTLRRALGDERAGPKYIETVARRGYRFVASVKIQKGDEDRATGTESETERQLPDRDIVSPTLVLAVLPFVNATGDPGLEYLAEGITDSIINSLSRVSRLRVMSRSAVFRRVKTDFDPLEIGRELGARAVLVGTISARPTREVEFGVGPAMGGKPKARAAAMEGDAHACTAMEGESAAGTGMASEVHASAVGGEPSAQPAVGGEIHARAARMTVGVELVDVATGWQLWGESFDSENKDLLQIQDAITRQLLANLKLKLTGEEEKHVTVRYTENAAAYQAYLEGRYHWSRYTRKGIEKAIGLFRQAIELDPNYALAYAAIVDCYLRLTTNYLPPDDDVSTLQSDESGIDMRFEQRIKLRFRWDWKGVERELRRANELKTNYPSIHQWYVAFLKSKQLYGESLSQKNLSSQLRSNIDLDSKLTLQIPSVQLTPAEEVQILCSVARDQMAIGNYDAARLMLRNWCVEGEWPKLDCLSAYAAADLLFTAGSLFGSIAGSKQVLHGHRRAEALLNGSIALFGQLGTKSRAAEAQVELTRCYYRQGLLDTARETVSMALSELPDDQLELKTFALIILGVIERDSGRLKDSLITLQEAARVEISGHLVTGRCNIDLATTLKDLAFSEGDDSRLAEAKIHFLRALYEAEALGHHRNVGSVENNIGFLLLNMGSYLESEHHLARARRVFASLGDSVRGAQVYDTLARLYIETKQYKNAQQAIDLAVETLELTDSEAILAEALTTKGVIACKLGHYNDGKKSFEAAHKVAERCGDYPSAVRALVGLSEEMGDRLDAYEALKIVHKLNGLLPTIQQASLAARVEESVRQNMSRFGGSIETN